MSDVIFTIRMRYNTRMQRWILDIADPANATILAGLPLLVERNVAGQYVMAGLPDGTIFVSDNTNQDEQATRDSFGLTHSLLYVTQ
jgi:hypothetical protein